MPRRPPLWPSGATRPDSDSEHFLALHRAMLRQGSVIMRGETPPSLFAAPVQALTRERPPRNTPRTSAYRWQCRYAETECSVNATRSAGDWAARCAARGTAGWTASALHAKPETESRPGTPKYNSRRGGGASSSSLSPPATAGHRYAVFLDPTVTWASWFVQFVKSHTQPPHVTERTLDRALNAQLDVLSQLLVRPGDPIIVRTVVPMIGLFDHGP